VLLFEKFFVIHTFVNYGLRKLKCNNANSEIVIKYKVGKYPP